MGAISVIILDLAVRSKELDFGTAKLSLMAFSFDENEMLHGDSLRPHACSSSCPQTLENDYSNMEVMVAYDYLPSSYIYAHLNVLLFPFLFVSDTKG